MFGYAMGWPKSRKKLRKIEVMKCCFEYERGKRIELLLKHRHSFQTRAKVVVEVLFFPT